MRTVVEESVRARPRPDPIPQRGLRWWAAHAPWILAALGTGTALLALRGRDLGLLACGASLALLLAALARVSLHVFCKVAHVSCGVLALGLLDGADVAGSYVAGAGALAVAMLLGRSFAHLVRPEVAPLAGRLPWIFPSSLRGAAIRFGIAGLAAAVPLAFLGPTPVLRVIGVAMLPLALRTYLLTLLAERTARAIWSLAVAVELMLLAALVTAHGPIGAAWAAVVAETTLFACSAFVVARRTGVAPLAQLQLLGLACTMVLVLFLTLRGGLDFLLLGGIVVGVVAGALFWPRRT
ncbi:MAG TPA: hypothetical protein VFY93_01650 [Planctomycetota bacterium]|nr:hypothetical protein [Planctomycetota bacterium]